MKKILIFIVIVILSSILKITYDSCFQINNLNYECCIDSGIDKNFIILEKNNLLTQIDENELKSKNNYLITIPKGIKKKESVKIENKEKNFLLPIIWRGITSDFGIRYHPVKKELKYHTGIDMRAYYTEVFAPKDAKVKFAGRKSGYGKIIILQHSNGYETRFAHLSEIYVENDEYVRKGKIIGRSGNTGLSTAPHLHYEIRKNGIPQNPMRYIKK